MKTVSDQTSWIHILALVALSGGGGAISMKQYERITAPAPSASEQRVAAEALSHQIDQRNERDLTAAITQVREEIQSVRPVIEKLSDAVQDLSRKVAVIEDRQARGAERLRP